MKALRWMCVGMMAWAIGCGGEITSGDKQSDEQAAIVCPAVYNPVCDDAGNIYSNTCWATGAGAEVSERCHVVDLEQPIQTAHNYPNNFRGSWEIVAPADADRVQIEIRDFATEPRFDVLRLTDGAGTTVASYDGTLGTFMAAPVEGNRATLQFSSDYSVTAYGFDVNRYVYFTPCTCTTAWAPVCGTDGVTYSNACWAGCAGATVGHFGECDDVAWYREPHVVESAHPYTNNLDQSWTVGEKAFSIRLHFELIDLEPNFDFLDVLDENDNLVASYTGLLRDVTTPVAAGGTLRIRLRTDGSVTRWGFKSDYFEVKGGCYSDLDCPGGRCIQVECFRAPCFKLCMNECPALMPRPDWFCDGGEVIPGGVDEYGCPQPDGCSRADGATCGGEHGFVCDHGFYCDFGGELGDGSCGTDPAELGVCRAFPVDCPRAILPVCGCDEANYMNACTAAMAGVSVAYMGECGNPFCGAIGSRSEGWYGDDGLIKYEFCAGTWAICDAVGTRSEGWYRSDDHLLIAYDFCAASAGQFCSTIRPCARELTCVENVCTAPSQDFAATDTPKAIPDRGSVTSTIAVKGVGVVARLTISMNISHTYRGDLVVSLSHGGVTATLHNRTGGSADNLIFVDLPVDAFAGATGEGDWVLLIRDEAAYDTGTLDSWSLDFE